MVSALLVVQVAALFLLAGLAEIGGGWLIWEAVRGQGRPWYWAAAGGVVLVTYGFIPTLQPLTDFGRLYAAYGGVFIGLSFAWGGDPRSEAPHHCSRVASALLPDAATRCSLG